jgi:phytanoyl-CoA hydroxylase
MTNQRYGIPEMQYQFSYAEADKAAAYFDQNGFVAFSDILSPAEVKALTEGVNQASAQGKLTIGDDEMPNNNDCVYAHPIIEETCRNPKLAGMARRLTGHPIELQHSKFNAKPLHDKGAGKVNWHQDFPFYPHTNFDLVSCLIHLDDEAMDAGPLRCIPGSHRWGPMSHVGPDGKFAYQNTQRQDLEEQPSVHLQGKAGMVTFHHCLTMHTSAPKQRAGHRRFVIFQYRAQDAKQLAGVIWKCHGMQVEAPVAAPNMARFADGTRVELRGLGGRIFDVAGQLKPNVSHDKGHPSQGKGMMAS